jgi:putative flavoprotein involved in K+ transport
VFEEGARWRGKKCVVVGASTSAHDICADLVNHGAQATMVQRSSVIVATSEALLEYAWGGSILNPRSHAASRPTSPT